MKINLEKDMRARTVNFERGQDPKKSLEIGIFGKLHELAKFLEKELSWNGAEVSVKDNGDLEYVCLPGNSVISEIKDAIEKFGWGGMMKVNIDDGCSRSYQDCSEHYYKISFKTPIKRKYGLLESLDFERGQDPKEALRIGVPKYKLKAERRFPDKKIAYHHLDRDNSWEYEYNGKFKEYNDPARFARHKDIIVIVDNGEILGYIPGPKLARGIGNCWGAGFYDADAVIHSPEWKPIDESLEFERGKDPKSSMDIGVENQILDVEVIRRQSHSTMAEMELSEKATIDLLKDPIKYAFRNKRFSYVIITPDNKGHFLRRLIDSFMSDGYRYFRYKGQIYPIKFLQDVKESLEFERGNDPKETLGVGMKEKLRERSLANLSQEGYVPRRVAAEIGGEFMFDIDLSKIYLLTRGGDDDFNRMSPLFDKKMWKALEPHLSEYNIKRERSATPSVKTTIYDTPYGKVVREHGNIRVDQYWAEFDTYMGLLKSLNESIRFEREGTPKEKLGIGKARWKPYPRMSVEEFSDWYEEEIEPYYDKEEHFDLILDNIVNNELESDEELGNHWLSLGVDPELVEKILRFRDYFMDFEYTKNLG